MRDIMAPARAASLFALLAFGMLGPLQAQDVQELIRMRVELLRAAHMLEVDGAPIAARNLIPRIYEARGFEPAWRSAQHVDSLLEMIEESRLEGLDVTDYHFEPVRAARAAFETLDELSPAERADLDILLTDSIIRLGYHLRFGKVDPVVVHSAWNLSRELAEDEDPVETIQAAIDAPSIREFARAVLPRGVLYQRLKVALAEHRAIAEAGGWPQVPGGGLLRPGMMDPRVPLLAQRLAATGDLEDGVEEGADLVYDEALAEALRRFQGRHGLARDGVLGPSTLAALNIPVERRIEQIRANLERARWVFNERESDFVLVNIAAFRLDLIRGGEVRWSTRVQVGLPYRRTPVFKSTLRYLVFNPTWTVPPNIFRRDILPEVRRDPGYLAARDIEVLDRQGERVDPASIDWVGQSFAYRLVQRPGPNNALGRVKFMFPNDYLVYLHDTPDRDLFDRESRAFSSGCIRVENPMELALLLLGQGWSQERIDALLATEQPQTVFLDRPVTIMLLYWTVEVDEAGQVHFWPDIYQRDDPVIEGLAEPFVPSPTL